MQEGPCQGAKNEHKQESLCSLALGAQEVQNVFEEKEPRRRESRVHDTVEYRVDGVAPYNDDDEDTDPLECLLHEWRDE